MGYYYKTEPEAAPHAISFASPKTHTPGSPVKERGYRFYNPVIGRWVSRDPIAERGGKNMNCFVRNEPVKNKDRLGKNVWIEILIHIGLDQVLEWVETPPSDVKCEAKRTCSLTHTSNGCVGLAGTFTCVYGCDLTWTGRCEYLDQTVDAGGVSGTKRSFQDVIYVDKICGTCPTCEIHFLRIPCGSTLYNRGVIQHGESPWRIETSTPAECGECTW